MGVEGGQREGTWSLCWGLGRFGNRACNFRRHCSDWLRGEDGRGGTKPKRLIEGRARSFFSFISGVCWSRSRANSARGPEQERQRHLVEGKREHELARQLMLCVSRSFSRRWVGLRTGLVFLRSTSMMASSVSQPAFPACRKGALALRALVWMNLEGESNNRIHSVVASCLLFGFYFFIFTNPCGGDQVFNVGAQRQGPPCRDFAPVRACLMVRGRSGVYLTEQQCNNPLEVVIE